MSDATSDDPLCPIYIQAKNFTPAKRAGDAVRVVVIHTAECAQTEGAAVALATWAAGPKAPQASWHYAVAFGEKAPIVQSVREACVAWAAPGANATGIQIELCGHASDPPASWLEGNGYEVFRNAARLCGRICKRWSIPLERLDEKALKAGQRGVIGHDTATKAFRKSTHTDPGKHFPWAEFLRLAGEE